MHRQSLGSSLLPPKHADHLSSETQKQSSPPSSSGSGTEEDEEVKKSMRPKHAHAAIPMAPETYIHLIPMLTLLCFLILFLASHRPSPVDLAEFSVPEAFSNRAELQGIRKGDTLAIRSLKNLEHEPSGRAKHRLLHRKIAHL